jgi:hypothetical protein
MEVIMTEISLDLKTMRSGSSHIPPLAYWNQRTRGLKNYPLIKSLDRAIETYWNNVANAKRHGGQPALSVFYALYDIYSSTMEWFQTRAKTRPLHGNTYNEVQDRINPFVQALLICSTRELKARLKITDNHALKQKVDEIVSIGLTGHGATCDQQAYASGGVRFLGRDELVSYCVVFKSCKAHRLNPNTLQPEILDTQGWPDGSKGGFVLTRNHVFYVSENHQISLPHQVGFFHSAYTSGDPVLCSGEIKFENGIPTQISNSSGHYRPSPNQLRFVLHLFKRYNIDITGLTVFARSGSGYITKLAPDFLVDPSVKKRIKQTDAS